MMRSFKYSKVYSISFFLTVLLLSCGKKDQPSPDQMRIATLEEIVHSTISSIPSRTLKYTFEYDQQHRISRINDRQFKYSEQDKVSSSRIYRITTDQFGLTQEYIESLKYQWDDQGRLAAIVADSIYHHHHTKSAGTVNTQLKSLYQGSVIAKHEYNGVAKLPASITYLVDYELPLKAGVMETMTFQYQENDILRSRQLDLSIAPGSGFLVRPAFAVYSHYRYDTNPHHLYGAYLQLGFHPYNFGSIVSQHHPVSVYSEHQLGDVAPTVNPDWNKAEKFVSEYNAQGYATSIKSIPGIGGASWRTIKVTYR
ncbi:hypothetical protein [Pedobacter immunditicola]|uniref:hypothetical protein n=1 Tax=Pedobacter immunditicola TaxID=3133440 RepID=UPI0030B4A6F7